MLHLRFVAHLHEVVPMQECLVVNVRPSAELRFRMVNTVPNVLVGDVGQNVEFAQSRGFAFWEEKQDILRNVHLFEVQCGYLFSFSP